ncbi:MAG TPA: hypothetical protein VEP48_09855 [Methylomirabilota bacterium]|nr:hypothetical protein [Methylomirabilota bacterium]
MKKLTLTTGALTAIAGSALLTGIAFASDAMRSSDNTGGGFVSALALSDERNPTKGEVIGTANIAMKDRAADVDKDVDDNDVNDVDVDNDSDNEVDVDNDSDEVDNDVDNNDDQEQAKNPTHHDTQDKDSQKHEHRGR